MRISATIGPDYSIQFSTTLTDWKTLTTTNSATMPFHFIDDPAGAATYRFYRVLLGP